MFDLVIFIMNSSWTRSIPKKIAAGCINYNSQLDKIICKKVNKS
jgi:hypothetical protein